jgi:hypothetical protein
MVPLAALLACSLYADDALVAAIVDNVEQNPFSIVSPDDTSDPNSSPVAPTSLEEARAKLREVVAHGGSPLLALMQVPPDWARTFGREPEELFDACVNVSIGTAMLSEFDYACAGHVRSARAGAVRLEGADSRRRCIADRYADAIGMPEVSTVVTLDLRYSRSRPAIASDAPIYAPARAVPGWGADCLLVYRAADSCVAEPLAGLTRGGTDPLQGHLPAAGARTGEPPNVPVPRIGAGKRLSEGHP